MNIIKAIMNTTINKKNYYYKPGFNEECKEKKMSAKKFGPNIS